MIDEKHKCRKCYKELNKRGSDNDLEYYDGMCLECFEIEKGEKK